MYFKKATIIFYSIEMMFVATNFPTTSKLYHLGINQYTDINGIFYSDNSFGVGLPFYTGIL